MVTGRGRVGAHIGYPTASFRAPMIYNPWFEAQGIDAAVVSLSMWGLVCRGYGAVFPSFCPELFHTRVRVTAMAVPRNVGTTITALLPVMFAIVAPPGSANIALTVGAIAFGITCIAAVAAFGAREIHRVHINGLGLRDAVPVTKAEYGRLRAD